MQRVRVKFNPYHTDKEYAYNWHGDKLLTVGESVVCDTIHGPTVGRVVALNHNRRGECKQVTERSEHELPWMTMLSTRQVLSSDGITLYNVDSWPDGTVTCECIGWSATKGCRHMENERPKRPRARTSDAGQTSEVKRRRKPTTEERRLANLPVRLSDDDDFNATLLRAVADAAAERAAKQNERSRTTDAERRTIQPTDKSKPGPRKRKPLPAPPPERTAEVKRRTFRPARENYPYNVVPPELRERKPPPRVRVPKPDRADYPWGQDTPSEPTAPVTSRKFDAARKDYPEYKPRELRPRKVAPRLLPIRPPRGDHPWGE